MALLRDADPVSDLPAAYVHGTTVVSTDLAGPAYSSGEEDAEPPGPFEDPGFLRNFFLRFT
jgi:hypothetical protein